MEKKTLDKINEEIAKLKKQRAQIFQSYQEKIKLLSDQKAEQETTLLAGEDTSGIVAGILSTQVEIQGFRRAVEVLDDEIEKLQKTQGIEAQWFALAQAEELAPEALDALKPAYEALVEFVERNSQAMAKAKELAEKLKKVKRPTPMTNLSQRLSGLFYDIEKELPLILERFPKEIFRDGSLPKPDELAKRLRRKPPAQGLPSNWNGNLEPPQNLHRG